MTEPRIHSESSDTPRDIARAARLLDRLVRSELDWAPVGLEDRIMHASFPALKGLAEPLAGVEALAQADRAGAMAGLEERVVEGSLGHLTGASTPVAASTHLHLAGEGRFAAPAPVRRRSWAFTGRVRAIAAVLFVGVGGVFVWNALTPSTPSVMLARRGTDASRLTTSEIGAKLDEGFDTLYSAMSDLNRVGDADSTSGSIDELLEEGAS